MNFWVFSHEHIPPMLMFEDLLKVGIKLYWNINTYITNFPVLIILFILLFFPNPLMEFLKSFIDFLILLIFFIFKGKVWDDLSPT